jgi:hypothetical protein
MKNLNSFAWLWLALVVGLLTSAPAHAFYNPQTGHWINRDPLVEQGSEKSRSLVDRASKTSGQSDSYLFIANNPENNLDVLGLDDSNAPTGGNPILPVNPPEGPIQVPATGTGVTIVVGDAEWMPCGCNCKVSNPKFHKLTVGLGPYKFLPDCHFIVRTGDKSRVELTDPITGNVTRIGSNAISVPDACNIDCCTGKPKYTGGSHSSGPPGGGAAPG